MTSARDMAIETAGKIMSGIDMVFKCDLRWELVRMLFPLCLLMAKVSAGIEEMQSRLSHPRYQRAWN